VKSAEAFEELEVLGYCVVEIVHRIELAIRQLEDDSTVISLESECEDLRYKRALQRIPPIAFRVAHRTYYVTTEASKYVVVDISDLAARLPQRLIPLVVLTALYKYFGLKELLIVPFLRSFPIEELAEMGIVDREDVEEIRRILLPPPINERDLEEPRGAFEEPSESVREELRAGATSTDEVEVDALSLEAPQGLGSSGEATSRLSRWLEFATLLSQTLGIPEDKLTDLANSKVELVAKVLMGYQVVRVGDVKSRVAYSLYNAVQEVLSSANDEELKRLLRGAELLAQNLELLKDLLARADDVVLILSKAPDVITSLASFIRASTSEELKLLRKELAELLGRVGARQSSALW